MSRNGTERRIEWTPGGYAQAELERARKLFPHLTRQALIDRLVIVAVSALTHARWTPPELHGNNRHCWRNVPREHVPARKEASPEQP